MIQPREQNGGAQQQGAENLQRRPAEATEDYLEAIDSLIDEKGFAASVDIAERLNVSKPTVTSMVKKLDREGFLVHEKYRGIKLTQKGKKLAEEMQKRHQLITSFLMLFGVDERVARQDAERIEHGLHADTLEKLGAFTEYVLSNPELIKEYRTMYSKRGELKSHE